MTQIPLLEPVVLNEVVQFLQIPENLVLSRSLPKVQTPTSYYTWDIVKGTRQMAKHNVPNSEANIVDQNGRSGKSASLAYIREKKAFEPTTTMWIRQLGSTTATQNAEQAIMAEIQNLNVRTDNRVEASCWAALHGNLTASDGNVLVDVDYGFDSDQFVQPGTPWLSGTDYATPDQLIADIVGWETQVDRKARVSLTDAWLTRPTMQLLFQVFANNSANGTGNGLLSDVMKDRYFNTGTLPGFLNLNWHIVEGQYDDDEGNPKQFVADNEIIFTNLEYGNAMKIAEGPSADFGAGDGAVGKYMKTWEQEDPSARFALLEYRYLPVITRTDQILVVTGLTA